MRPRNFIPTELQPLLPQRFPNQIPPLRRDMTILFPEYHHQLAFDVASALETVVVLAVA